MTQLKHQKELQNMNKNDFKLIFILIIFIIILFPFFNIKNNDKALVYYKNELILSIDLNIDKTYEVNGKNGTVKIVVKDNKIKVDSENSPKHICSKQGYISKSYESIVCLPNEIVIKIENKEEIDSKVG